MRSDIEKRDAGAQVSSPGAVDGEATRILMCDWLRDPLDGLPMNAERVYYETSRPGI